MTQLLVLADPFTATSLARHVPSGWVVHQSATLPAHTDADLIVLYRADGRSVAEARRRHPGVPVLAVVGRDAPTAVIVQVLEAGADACVRDTSAVVVISHVHACRRRARVAAAA